MKSEQEIRERIEELDAAISAAKENGDVPILAPQQKRALEWVLGESSDTSSSGSDHWTGQSGGQRR